MNGVLRTLFTVAHDYPNTLLRQRAQGLIWVIWSSLVGWGLYVFGLALPNIAGGNPVTGWLNPGFALVPFACVFALWALQRGRLQTAAFLVVGGLASATLPLLFNSPDPHLFLAAVVPVVAAGVLLKRPQFLLFVALILGLMIGRALWLSTYTQEYVYIPANNVDVILIVPLVTIGTAVLFLFAFSGNTAHVASNALDETAMMRAIVQQSIKPESNADESAALSDMLNILQTRMGFFNAELYMSDDDNALLRRTRTLNGLVEATGNVRPKPGSLVSLVALSKTRIIADSSAEASTRALVTAPARKAVALPLLVGETMLGVVEVQSDSSQPFTPSLLATVELLVQQTSQLVVRSRRLNDAETTARDAQTTLQHMSTQLRERGANSARTLKTGWDDYMKKRGDIIGFNLERNDGSSLVAASDLPETLRSALLRGQTAVTDSPDGQVLNVPLVVRGELLGAMSFTLPAGSHLSERQIDLTRSVAERLGAALENTRLLEQTRGQAQREQKASEVGSRLLGLTDVQAVLDLAASDFQEILGAVYTRVYVKPEAVSDERIRQEGS
jgi:GAF domain-containing protein